MFLYIASAAYTGLNVGGPFFENAWNKYRPSTVRAFVTSLVFVFVAVAACLVYRFRYRYVHTSRIFAIITIILFPSFLLYFFSSHKGPNLARGSLQFSHW